MSEEKKKLDDFLDALQQYSIPAEPPQEAVDKLLERLAPKADSDMRYPSGRTSNKTIVKFAAAAIFFAVIIVSAVVFYNIEKDKIKNALKMPYKGSPVRQKDQQLEVATKIKLQHELDQITKRYAARDVKGLIEVLDSGQYETKLAVAYFLGEIGDLPAAEAIEKYASLWTGNIEENPFIKAAAKIRNRLISKSVPAPQIEEDVNDSNELLIQEPNIPKIVKAAEPIDSNKLFIEGVKCRLFGPNETITDGILYSGNLSFDVLKNGSIYYSDVNLPKGGICLFSNEMPHHNILFAAYDHNRKYAKSFVWFTDANNYDIYLEPVSKITGTIVSNYQINFDKIEITPRILYESNENAYSLSSTVFRKSDITIDNKGRFTINCVPPGMALVITVISECLQGEIELNKIEAGQSIDVNNILLESLTGFENSNTQWTGKLSGKVVNENNEPLLNAQLLTIIGYKSFHASSDPKGDYQIEGLPIGKTIEIIAHAVGYDSNNLTTVVTDREYNIKLYPIGYELLNKQSPNLFVERWLNCPPVSLPDFRGKVVLVQYDDVRVPNNMQELIRFKYAYGELFEPVFIQHKKDLDGKKFNEEEIIQYIQKNNINFPCGIEGNLAHIPDLTLPVYKLYKTGKRDASSPQSYLIDRKGIVRAYPTMNNLEEWIEKLIAEE
jgi:hypothetical protein